VVACVALCSAIQLRAQLHTLNPAEPGLGGGALAFDSIEQRLYSRFAYGNWNGYAVNRIASWEGENWTTVGGGLAYGSVYYMALFQGELFISGSLDTWTNGYTMQRLARWDGSNWNACGDPDVYVHLVVIENELWMLGSYVTIGTQAISQIAKWDGSSWIAFGDPIPPGQGITHCGAFYQGEYYFAGTQSGSGVFDGEDIIKWDGSQWIVPGGGTPDPGMTILSSMAEYQGKLYIGGGIQTGPSHNIIVWNGSSYEGFFPDLVFNWGGVYKMEVIGGKLYLAGSWVFEGDDRSYGLLIYDGTTLCAVGWAPLSNMFLGEIREFAGDSHRIFFSCINNYVLSGDSVNFFGYWNTADGPDTCITIPTSMREPDVRRVLPVYPNPASEVLHLELGVGHGAGTTTVEVFDTMGRRVMQRVAKPDQRGVANLVVEDLSPGSYYGVVSGEERRSFRFLRE
jgi:Secretion system C-terminal sorting domain